MSSKRKQTAFVAYSSKVQVVAGTINTAILRANRYRKDVRFEEWTNNDVSGIQLVTPIIDKIKESDFIVADITTLNLNVVYEIGYAIGSQKRVFLIRHQPTSGDLELARQAGIFDTLGYEQYSSVNDLHDLLTSYIDTTPQPISNVVDRTAPVYLVEPLTRTIDVTRVVSRIKKARYRYRSFAPSEDVRLSANDAIRQTACSSGVVLMLQNEDLDGSSAHNVRTMFVAGLAHGLDKPTLILANAVFTPPLDVIDAIKYFSNESDIAEHIANFCPEINEKLQQLDDIALKSDGILQNIWIGDPTAENEMTTLKDYYLPTDEFRRALRGEVNLVLGRKGSGKTALFLQVRDKIRSDKSNIVVDLKPEGYQLVKIKEDILLYLTHGARQHLITAFWEYLILLEVAYKLLEKDERTHRYNQDIYQAYRELQESYRTENFAVEGDFSERLLTLSLRLADHYRSLYGNHESQRLTADQVTELLYTRNIRDLRDKIAGYLKRKNSVWVLFDNLDKGWSTQGVDEIDVLVLRCLIDAGRKVERDLRKGNVECKCIIFIRNDVYDHLMSNSSDYGKDMRAVLDWSDRDLLREMLRLRLASSVDGMEELSFAQLWTNICVSHYNGEESSAFLIDRSLMRPRNVLKLFNYATGFANNFNRIKISEEDISKGVLAYSYDLLIELNRELADLLRDADDLLYCFIGANEILSRDDIDSLLADKGISREKLDQIVDFMLYYGVLGFRIEDSDKFIYDENYDLKLLKGKAERFKTYVQYVVNPAFWEALGVNVTNISKRYIERP